MVVGYLAEGKVGAFFIRVNDEQEKEMLRLHKIGTHTRKKRIKKKIAKRIDSMIPVE